MQPRNRVLVDGLIFGGLAGISSLIILTCVGYYFDVGSMQGSVDHFIP